MWVERHGAVFPTGRNCMQLDPPVAVKRPLELVGAGPQRLERHNLSIRPEAQRRLGELADVGTRVNDA